MNEQQQKYKELWEDWKKADDACKAAYKALEDAIRDKDKKSEIMMRCWDEILGRRA